MIIVSKDKVKVEVKVKVEDKVKVKVKVETNVEVGIKAYGHILKSLSQQAYFKVNRPIVIGVSGQGH